MPDISVDPAGVFPFSAFIQIHEEPRNTQQDINFTFESNNFNFCFMYSIIVRIKSC